MRTLWEVALCRTAGGVQWVVIADLVHLIDLVYTGLDHGQGRRVPHELQGISTEASTGLSQPKATAPTGQAHQAGAQQVADRRQEALPGKRRARLRRANRRLGGN